LTALEEGEGEVDDPAVLHQAGMRGVNHDVPLHAGDLRPLDGHLAIVSALDHQAVDPVQGPVPGDDAQLEVRRTQALGD
jgi:hypothetical protein